MLDWLRYLPLTLSGMLDTTTYVVPKGPYFAKLRSQNWRIGDSLFHFKAPWSNSTYGSEQHRNTTQNLSSGRNDILNYSLRHIDEAIMPNHRWQCSAYHYRRWYFMAPWFSGYRARLSMSGTLYGHVKEDFTGSSFFHPRVFETAIADFLSSRYGFEKIDREARYRGPLSWKIIMISPTVQAASFEVFDGQGSEITKHVVFPVSHDRFVCISFGGLYQRDMNYDQTPLINLLESIIDSFTLEVGPTMQAQWNEIKSFCPDMSLTAEYGELKWPIKPESVGNSVEPSPKVAKNNVLISSQNKLN